MKRLSILLLGLAAVLHNYAARHAAADSAEVARLDAALTAIILESNDIGSIAILREVANTIPAVDSIADVFQYGRYENLETAECAATYGIRSRLESIGAVETVAYLKALFCDTIWAGRITEREYVRADSLFDRAWDIVGRIDMPRERQHEWKMIFLLRQEECYRFCPEGEEMNPDVHLVYDYLQTCSYEATVERFLLYARLLLLNTNYNFISIDNLDDCYDECMKVAEDLGLGERTRAAVRVNCLGVKALMSSNPMMTLIEIENFISEIRAANFYSDDLEAVLHFILGTCNYWQGYNTTALSEMEKSRELYDKIPSKSVRYSIYSVSRWIASIKIRLGGSDADAGWREYIDLHALLSVDEAADSQFALSFLKGCIDDYRLFGRPELAKETIDEFAKRVEAVAEVSDVGGRKAYTALAILYGELGSTENIKDALAKAYAAANRLATDDSERANNTAMYANYLYNIAGATDSALVIMHEAADAYGKLKDAESVAYCEKQLSYFYFQNGEHRKSLEYAEKVCDWYEKSDKSSPEVYIEALVCKAYALSWLKELDEGSEQIIRQIISLVKNEVVFKYDYAVYLANAYILYGDFCTSFPDKRLDEAEEYYNQAANTLSALLPNQMANYADAMVKLSRVYAYKNDVKNMRATLDKAIAKLEEIDEQISYPYFTLLVEAFNISSEIGEISSQSYYLGKLNQYFNIMQKSASDNSKTLLSMWVKMLPNMINWWSGMRSTMLTAGENFAETATQYDSQMKTVIEGYEELAGSGEYDTMFQGYVLVSKGLFCATMNELDEAEACFTKAIEMNVEPEYSKSSLVEIYTIKGEYAKAYALHKEILDASIEDKRGDISIANFLRTDVLLLSAMGRNDEAMESAWKMLEHSRRAVNDTYSTISGNDRAALSGNVMNPGFYYNLAGRLKTGDAAALAYDAAVFFKGVLTRSEAGIRKSVMASGDSALIKDYGLLSGLRREFMGMSKGLDASTGAVMSPEESYRYAELGNKINRLDASIANRSAVYRNEKAKNDATWKDIKKRLRRDEAAVEMVQLWDSVAMSNRYAALVVRHDSRNPEYVPLLTERQLDSLRNVDMIKEEARINAIYQKPTRLRRNNRGDAMYAMLWQPVDEHLSGINRVYYSPVGKLFTVAFSALADTSGRCLIERYDMRMMSNTALLLADTDKGFPAIDRALVCGGIIYDRDSTLNRSEWQHLPFSDKETAQVNDILKSGGISTTYRTGLDVPEAFIDSCSSVPFDVFQISTHGFYRGTDFPQWRTLYAGYDPQSLSPMQRSGLVLSDGNPSWHGEREVSMNENNILTANEIAELDFSTVKLVVLSACETGLGFPDMNEGIDGLQRGFKLAGAGAIVSSLWSVNDKAGSEFITSFYRRLLEHGDLHKAFRDTQLQLKEVYPSSPFKWACFVILD